MAPGGVRFSSVGPFHPPATLHNLSLALFTSTLIHIFIADPLSCKAYHQHIEGSSTLSADLQSVDETWWAEGKQLLWQQQSLCWAFLSSEMQHWYCIFEWERKREGGKVYILVIWCSARRHLEKRKYHNDPLPQNRQLIQQLIFLRHDDICTEFGL